MLQVNPTFQRLCRMGLLLMSSAGFFGASGQSSAIRNTYSADSSYPVLKVERSFVYHPDSSWLYSHHPYLTHFGKYFIAMWSNGYRDEDQPGQRVAYALSEDGLHWQKPRVLAEPGPFRGDTLNVLTAAGFYIWNDSLIAYYGEYSPHRTHTKLWARVSTDGLHWGEPIDMQVPVNPNMEPRRLLNGRLLICGNFSFPYTDDPRGLSGWTLSSFYPATSYKEDNPATFYAPASARGYPPLCEGNFIQTDDSVIHMLLRVTGKGWQGRLWQSESRDAGSSWSAPRPTDFSDNDSKFFFGRLPDGRFYYVGIPDSTHHYERSPLVISLSSDGLVFDRHYIIAREPYRLRQEGLWKGGQYGYPVGMLAGDYLYVIASRQKEAIEVLRFPLSALR